MNEPNPASKPIYNLLPTDVEVCDSLAELAMDIRWSWTHAADEVWRQLDPVRVGLYAEGINGGSSVRQEMKRVRQLPGAPGGYVYSAAVSAAGPPADYAARVIPQRSGVAVPREAAHILWQR